MKVCVCGGGNLGHTVSGFLAAQKGVEVNLLTRKPEQWQHDISLVLPNGEHLQGHLHTISHQPAEAIGQSDMVILCLPGFSIREVLMFIREVLPEGTPVGSIVSSTGFFFEAEELLPSSTPLFGFQRVPFISRIIEYGRSAHLMGYKPQLHVAIEHTEQREKIRSAIEQLFKTPTQLLGSHFEVSLTNSNPLLHPSRLYSLWKDWKEGDIYSHCPLFYEEWTEEAAQLYIAMDQELQTILEHLPVRKGAIPTVLDYYESNDAVTLAQKLRSIEAFKGILAPMKKVENGFIPDFQSRYFTEDFPYGLACTHRMAKKLQIEVPTIERVFQWGINIIRK